MLERLNLTGAEVVRIEPNWSERFVRFIATIAPVLLMIGFAALYAEIRSPGFGVFGIIGIICLGLVFGGQYIVGLAAYTELLLLIIGVLLLAMELFVIPGFGIAGIAGIAFMAAGMILSFQDFVIPQPEFPWQAQLLERNLLMVLLSLFGSTILLFLFFRYLFPRLGTVVPGPYLSHSLAQTRHDSEEPSAVKPGETGVVVSPLRPSGKVRIGDDVYDVIADGEFLDKGTAIVVTAVRGSRIVVARSTGDADAH
jgi:membrane-bound serine protease (ClpP class)